MQRFFIKFKKQKGNLYMEFVNRPILEFYRDSLLAAHKKGFFWVVTLLARECDVDGLYLNLRKSWTSLDSITGKYFLFVLAGKENTRQDERWESSVFDSQVRYFREYNDYIKFINPNIELEDLYLKYDYDKSLQNKMYMLEENQTIAVNILRDYFGIDERQIPCLVFTKLYSYNRDNYVIPIYGNDIYGYFKQLFNIIDPFLKKHMRISSRLEEIKDHKEKLKKEISKYSLNTEEKILLLQKELLLLAESNIQDEQGRTLFECINNLFYGKFERPIRSMLSRYIDWVKAYEKRMGKPFQANSIEDIVCKKTDLIIQAKNDLLNLEKEEAQLITEISDIIMKIEETIGDSKMEENIKRDERLSVYVMGGNAQINTAFDNSKIEPKQCIECDKKEFEKLLQNIRNTISSENTVDDSKSVNTYLDKIENEFKQATPKEKTIKEFLSKLETIKGTVEFGAAVTALIQFFQSF